MSILKTRNRLVSFCHLVPPQDTKWHKVPLSGRDTKWHNVCHLVAVKTLSGIMTLSVINRFYAT